MPTAFLLRYQEFCLVDDVPDIRCGTQTYTKIRTEQPDNDPGVAALVTLPRLGAFTKIKIKGEEPNHTLGEVAVQAVLRPTLLSVAQTKTVS